MRNEDSITHLNKFGHNPKYLQSASFETSNIELDSDLTALVSKAEILIVAVPSAFIHETLKVLPKDILKDKVIFSAVKGMIPEYNVIPARYFHKHFDVPYENIGIICGPCHVKKLLWNDGSLDRGMFESRKGKTDGILSAADMSTLRFLTIYLALNFQPFKKRIRPSCGVTSVCYGDNFQAILISNSIREIEKFIDAVHPIHRDTKRVI